MLNIGAKQEMFTIAVLQENIVQVGPLVVQVTDG